MCVLYSSLSFPHKVSSYLLKLLNNSNSWNIPGSSHRPTLIPTPLPPTPSPVATPGFSSQASGLLQPHQQETLLLTVIIPQNSSFYFETVTVVFGSWRPHGLKQPGFPSCISWSVLKLVHPVGDAIQPSRPLLSPFSSCLQSFPASGTFLMSGFPIRWPKVLELQLQPHSFQ